MADIALTTAGRVEVLESNSQTTLQAGVAVTAGQAIRPGTNGTWILALATAASNGAGVHIATKTAAVGEGLTGIRAGVMDGFALSGLAQNDSVFLSDTSGAIATGSGTASIQLGRVMPANATPLGTAPDKVLRLACPV